jgi:hypothetical protein
MAKLCHDRLVVLGSQAQVQRFQASNWNQALRAWHGELLENSPRRFACQFDTEGSPLEPLRRLSRRWPQLVLLLDYEMEPKRIKGLAKARAGQLEHWETNY